jgi:two-component system phosphate regulon sensor histidine kinase PhoR
MIQDVFALIEPRARQKEQPLLLGEVAPGPIWADGRALEQVLVNLVDNAHKYAPAGQPIEVRVVEAGDGRRRVEVVDQGPGVSPHHRRRLWERFYRVDPGRSREVGGTGLGLAIVKHLVEAMGGTVGMRPNRPQGSIFWVDLPHGPVAASAPERLPG